MTRRFEQDLAETSDPDRRRILERLIAYGEAVAGIARLVGRP